MKKEVTYTLTLKGLLMSEFSEEVTQDIIDLLELYMRRHGYNGIVLEDTLVFRKLLKK